jgi:NADH-quinone oxidoreductase subunit D
MDAVENIQTLDERKLEDGTIVRELMLNMGPQHPSTHGVLHIELHLKGEYVTKCYPKIGYLHRCFEKHAENVTFEQVIPYLDRLDYVSSINQEWSYCLALERMLDIKVPERVEYLRVITAELNRIASHLIGISAYGLDIGALTPYFWNLLDREVVLDLFEELCGARLLYNYFCVGGVLYDAKPGWVEHVLAFLEAFEPHIDKVNRVLTWNPIFIDRTAEVGVIDTETALSYGFSGPNLRACGYAWDLRRDDPYSIYDRFDFETCVGTGEYGTIGSCWDRHWVRMQEMVESIRIIRQAVAQLPAGDVKEAVPKRVKPPVGEIYARTETPRGDLGVYVVADKKGPFRVKVRSPGFCVLSALPVLAVNCSLQDVVAIIGSLDFVMGDVDR